MSNDKTGELVPVEINVETLKSKIYIIRVIIKEGF